MADIAQLAQAQLDAYNTGDLDAFIACYHPDVVVMEGDEVSFSGREAMREQYRDLFADWTFGAAVPERLVVGPHCVDYERYWRVDPETAERSEGDVLVRYTMADGLIARVQFLGD